MLLSTPPEPDTISTVEHVKPYQTKICQNGGATSAVFFEPTQATCMHDGTTGCARRPSFGEPKETASKSGITGRARKPLIHSTFATTINHGNTCWTRNTAFVWMDAKGGPATSETTGAVSRHIDDFLWIISSASVFLFIHDFNNDDQTDILPVESLRRTKS